MICPIVLRTEGVEKVADDDLYISFSYNVDLGIQY